MPYARRNQAGEIVEVTGSPRSDCNEVVPEGTVPATVTAEAASAETERLRREGLRALVTALDAGTATNAQVQRALAWLIRESFR